MIKSLEKLKSEFQNKDIPYSELLNTKEWSDCRILILKKYNDTCVHCGDKFLDELVEIPLELAEEIKETLSISFKRIEVRVHELTNKLNCNFDSYSSDRMKFPKKLHKYKNRSEERRVGIESR